MRVASNSASTELNAILGEIRRVEAELLAHQDQSALENFGNERAGARVASLLGFASVTAREARIVDQLRYFPSSIGLIREFLGWARQPSPSETYWIEDDELEAAVPVNLRRPAVTRAEPPVSPVVRSEPTPTSVGHSEARSVHVVR
jgi:hypothetical protein